MKKKLLAAVAAGLIALGSFGISDAASREEIAAIHVEKVADFQFWNENSPTKQKIIEFVEDVTNPYSENYIPPEDRIATFDMDGTFYCETAPIYFQEAMFLHRVLEDKNYNYDAEYFSVKPNWNFEYIAVLKDYAQDRNFAVRLDPANAELLYQNERKLQIFADLTYIDGRITILNLYLETNTLGRISIESILRELEKLDAAKTSGAENAGYGLEIITAYKD